MTAKNIKIGVWGFGVVGKSVVKYFLSAAHTNAAVSDSKIAHPERSRRVQRKVEFAPYFDKLSMSGKKNNTNGKNSSEQNNYTYSLFVTNNKELSQADQAYLEKNNIIYQRNLEQFLEECDYIVPSPGIDLRDYQKYSNKYIAELDLFAGELESAEHKPQVITITGTLGKTTITHCLSELLKKSGKRACAAGNIGDALLNTVPKLSSLDNLVLELSSYQLEHAGKCAPHLAIITNLYPKHLDRHGTMDAYWQAKYNSIRYQKAHQKALVPLEFIEQVYATNPEQQIAFFCEVPLHPSDFAKASTDRSTNAQDERKESLHISTPAQYERQSTFAR